MAWPAPVLMAVALLAIDSPIVLAQESSGETQQPRPAEPSPTTLSLFDTEPPPSTRSPSALESWLSVVDMKCTGCRESSTILRPEPTNRNAPWVLQGTWQRHTPFGVASLGFVGIRNFALPLSTVLPLGGSPNPTVWAPREASLLMPSTQWSVTAGIEKTVMNFSKGATVGLVGDFIVPVQTTSAVASDPRVSGMKSAALRFGIVVRW